MLSCSTEDITRILGKEVRDLNGDSVGYVHLMFVDDETGRPEWMGVWNGLPGSRRHLVLVAASRSKAASCGCRGRGPRQVGADRRQGARSRPHSRRPDGIHISAEKERAAYEHYGLEPESPVQEGVIRLRAVVVTVGRGD